MATFIVTYEAYPLRWKTLRDQRSFMSVSRPIRDIRMEPLTPTMRYLLGYRLFYAEKPALDNPSIRSLL